MNTQPQQPEPYTSYEFDKDDNTVYTLVPFNKESYARLRIVRDDGSYFSVFHDDVHTLEGTEDGTKLTLCIKGGLLVTLEGENLVKLAHYLEDAEIRKLYCYQPSIHKLRDTSVPIIHRIVESGIA